jgi:hypothetical protein
MAGSIPGTNTPRFEDLGDRLVDSRRHAALLRKGGNRHELLAVA